MTRPEDVPQKLVDRMCSLMMKLSGYRPEVCPPLVKAKFEAVSRTACAIIIDEERARYAQTQTN